MLNKIIEDKCIQQVGIEYAELIISNEEFVSFVKKMNEMSYKIVEISWWEHREISNKENKTSMGGPIDIKNNKFYWGETNYCKTFDSKELTDNLKEVLDYYYEFSEKIDLFPSITLDIAFGK